MRSCRRSSWTRLLMLILVRRERTAMCAEAYTPLDLRVSVTVATPSLCRGLSGSGPGLPRCPRILLHACT